MGGAAGCTCSSCSWPVPQISHTHTGLRDGWGLTTDGTHLIATDSSAEIYFLDPSTNPMKVVRKVTAMDAGHPLKWLNEVRW